VSHGHTEKDERAKAQVLHELDRRDRVQAERRRRGEAVKNTRAAQRQEREAHVENEYVRAEEVTRGNLVNAKGRARGVDPRRPVHGPRVRCAAVRVGGVAGVLRDAPPSDCRVVPGEGHTGPPGGH
jgi:hypothetical protein